MLIFIWKITSNKWISIHLPELHKFQMISDICLPKTKTTISKNKTHTHTHNKKRSKRKKRREEKSKANIFENISTQIFNDFPRRSFFGFQLFFVCLRENSKICISKWFPYTLSTSTLSSRKIFVLFRCFLFVFFLFFAAFLELINRTQKTKKKRSNWAPISFLSIGESIDRENTVNVLTVGASSEHWSHSKKCLA